MIYFEGKHTPKQELTHRHPSQGKQENVGRRSENKITQGTEQNTHQQGSPSSSHIAPAALRRQETQSPLTHRKIATMEMSPEWDPVEIIKEFGLRSFGAQFCSAICQSKIFFSGLLQVEWENTTVFFIQKRPKITKESICDDLLAENGWRNGEV